MPTVQEENVEAPGNHKEHCFLFGCYECSYVTLLKAALCGFYINFFFMNFCELFAEKVLEWDPWHFNVMKRWKMNSVVKPLGVLIFNNFLLRGTWAKSSVGAWSTGMRGGLYLKLQRFLLFFLWCLSKLKYWHSCRMFPLELGSYCVWSMCPLSQQNWERKGSNGGKGWGDPRPLLPK